MAYSRKSKNPTTTAILTSISYSDIFNFPLSKDELFNFLITDKKISYTSFNNNLKFLKKDFISEKDGFFCFKRRERIIEKREKKEKEVYIKNAIAEKATFFLSYLPSILFIGISGGLAMGDVDESDDIDLFIIVKKNSLFKTRLAILLTLQFLGMRRKRNEQNPRNKICTNFLIDETGMYFSSEKHDVYTAHEILQIKPLFDKKNTFNKFIRVNKWVYTFFPNARLKKIDSSAKKKNYVVEKLFLIMELLLLESFSRKLQLFFINKHKKNETVTNNVLAFNPNDYRVHTLRKLRLKLHVLGLLTKE